jgi:hypothetical protein
MLHYESPTDLRYRIDYINQLNSQLIQRVNYFLVGIAFLVTAFVNLVISNSFPGNPYLICLAALICGTGCYISLLFAVMNYENSKRYKDFANKIYDFPTSGYSTWTKSLWIKRGQTIRPKWQDDELHVPHLTLIPIIFTLFWSFITIGIDYYVMCECNGLSGYFRYIFICVCGLIVFPTAIILFIEAIRNFDQKRAFYLMISPSIIIFIVYLASFIGACNLAAKI